MKNSLFLLLFASLSLIGCKTTVPASPSINKSDYKELSPTDNFDNYLGQKVQFKARICLLEMQHMLVLSLEGKRTYICLDRLTNEEGELGDQLLAYTSDKDILSKDFKNNKFTVFGTIKATSGVGKGGGIHKEYYLELDRLVD